MILAAKRNLLIWIAISALCGAAVEWLTGSLGYAVGVIFGILILCLLLVYRGLINSSSETSSAEYFGARSLLQSTTTTQALGAAWVMLGNVVIANMIFAQLMGLWMLWVLVTWAWAFLVMSRHAARIHSLLSPEDTLHSFLHAVYGKRLMRLTAALITVFVGIGVFSVEILAGIAILLAVLPENLAALAAPLLIVTIVLATCVNAITGGLRSVVTSDSIFWPLIIGALVIMLFMALAQHATPGRPPLADLRWFPTDLAPRDIAAFAVGLFALQVPLLLCDFGTWQRVKATTPEQTTSLVRLLRTMSGWQALLWGIPVVVGIIIAAAPPIDAGRTGSFYATAAPVIELIRHWVAAATVPAMIKTAVLAVFVSGMLAVMISTANTYLMVALESWVHDFKPLPTSQGHDFDTATPVDVRRARTLCVLFALIGCIPVLVYVSWELSLLSIIFIVFGSQVALAPAVILAIYFAEDAKALAVRVMRVTLLGFLSSICFGLLCAFGVLGDWFAASGAFLAPVVALGIPMLVLVISLVARRGSKEGWSFLSLLTVPKGPEANIENPIPEVRP
jgi:Na+/proline symporter